MSKPEPRIVPARSARTAAKLFNYGNILAVLMPFPLIIFWFGASMFVYAMNRHHPNERVGHYTQQAAYRFYAIVGALIVVGTFFPPRVKLLSHLLGAHRGRADTVVHHRHHSHQPGRMARCGHPRGVTA
jgi:hypothetical protein